ncbi:MAG: hypothetical protein LBL75_01890 [Rickettsiales bacterium]|jgi:Zn-dependent membrane protease YugP|nr:hypothetical protein [Rickettsiales bacterium]
MNNDERVFRIGVGLVVAMFVIGIVLQVCYRAQSRSMARINANIVKTQQETAQAQAVLSTMVRPDVLRARVASVYQNYESIGFKKNINVVDIPIQEAPNTDV